MIILVKPPHYLLSQAFILLHTIHLQEYLKGLFLVHFSSLYVKSFPSNSSMLIHIFSMQMIVLQHPLSSKHRNHIILASSHHLTNKSKY